MKLASFFEALCVYFLLPLFSFFSNIFRLESKVRTVKKNAPHADKEDPEFYYSSTTSFANQDLRFKFKFRTLDEYSRRDETGMVSSASKYQFSASAPVREINGEKMNSENSDNMIISIKGEAQCGPDNNFLCEGDFREEFLNSELEFLSEKDFNSEMNSSRCDADKMESLWEHQELIEQLKMELRNIKATGLPTILEESETEELKSRKMVDDNLEYQECMEELRKFHRSYTDTMRKFDILNYQKMYAMGFLQLKDPFQRPKHSPPTLKSLVSQNLWLSKHKTHGSAPIKKFINELAGDLEAVYVGQMCLSWEMLHYQYQKALHLWNSNSHRYNEVAVEFQQFQELLQQFMEDEALQGPRVHSYVRNRCVLRNILQVPAIREDKVKGRRREREQKEAVMRSENLVEILEESIGTMWRFVRSDKDCNSIKKSADNAEDLKLLADVRKLVQKKDRKLKEIVRSEKCILKKWHENPKEEDLNFLAQVDIKLVYRILNMSRITRDQLLWCQNKLSRITFLNNKILVNPAFFIFPCT